MNCCNPNPRVIVTARARTSLLSLLLAISSSCTQYIPIAPADYADMEPCRERGYRIRTTDRQQYIVTCLAVEDSAFIIQELKVEADDSKRPVPFAGSCSMLNPISISDGQFILTFGELELAPDGDGGENMVDGGPMFAHMSGVSGRVLNQAVQQVFHNRLEQNFPNPFNPQTSIAYSLKDASSVSLTIYDVAGRRVRELLNEQRKPGAYKVVWDGRDGRGTQVASGVYFYKLVAGSFVDTKKMIMLK